MIDIKTIRQQKHMTQFQLSLKSGLPQSELSRFERTGLDGIKLKSLCKLAKGLDLKLYDLIEDKKIIDRLQENIDFEPGIFLDGKISPIAEILDIYGMTQTELCRRTEISNVQLSRWVHGGMDSATLDNFLKIGKALKANIWLLIADKELQDLFCEVT